MHFFFFSINSKICSEYQIDAQKSVSVYMSDSSDGQTQTCIYLAGERFWGGDQYFQSQPLACLRRFTSVHDHRTRVSGLRANALRHHVSGLHTRQSAPSRANMSTKIRAFVSRFVSKNCNRVLRLLRINHNEVSRCERKTTHAMLGSCERNLQRTWPCQSPFFFFFW